MYRINYLNDWDGFGIDLLDKVIDVFVEPLQLHIIFVELNNKKSILGTVPYPLLSELL